MVPILTICEMMDVLCHQIDARVLHTIINESRSPLKFKRYDSHWAKGGNSDGWRKLHGSNTVVLVLMVLSYRKVP